jgi:hypothetical protein
MAESSGDLIEPPVVASSSKLTEFKKKLTQPSHDFSKILLPHLRGILKHIED